MSIRSRSTESVCNICKSPELGISGIPTKFGNICSSCNAVVDELQIDHDITTKINDYITNPPIHQGWDDYIIKPPIRQSWDDYFIALSLLVSTRSKDESTKVGAVIVKDRTIISTGYNGFPRGVNDYIDERNDRPLKYSWTIHAEENAIFNAARLGVSLEGATLYVTPLSPCTKCANAIIQSGIVKVVVQYVHDPRWADQRSLALDIFEAAGILVTMNE